MKQVSFSDFRATILPANGQMTQEYKNNLQIHFTSSQHPFKWESTGNGLILVLPVDPHKDAPVLT
jgi:hypothetical protein